MKERRPTFLTSARLFASALAFVIAAFNSSAHAGYVVLLGDSTPVSYLSTITEPTFGTARFFNNLLSGGDNVALLGDPFGGVNSFAYTFYNREGHSASFLTGAVTDQSLAGVDLAVLINPTRAFTISEADALERMLVSGGNILAVESPGMEFTYDLFSKLNVDMEHTSPNVDSGQQAATGNRIATHPLTVGVDSFRYGGTYRVTGGTPLFLTTGGEPLAAVTFVPEPATTGLVLAPALFLACRRRSSHNRE